MIETGKMMIVPADDKWEYSDAYWSEWRQWTRASEAEYCPICMSHNGHSLSCRNSQSPARRSIDRFSTPPNEGERTDR